MVRCVFVIGFGACCAFVGCSKREPSPAHEPNVQVASDKESVADRETTDGESPREGEKGGTTRVGLPSRVGEPTVGKRYAVLVGINEYNFTQSLKYCGRDMEELKRALIEWGGYEEQHVTLLLGKAGDSAQGPTKGVIYDALRRVCTEAKEDDSILFAFSGHGECDVDGRTYLIPSDGSIERESLADTGLRVGRVHELMGKDACKARQKLVILDCCHAGGKKGSSAPAHSPLEPLRGHGIMELLSCDEDEVSRETDDFGGHGLFSYFLIQAIRTGAADEDGNRHVSVLEVKNYVERQMQTYIRGNKNFRGHRQSPMIRGQWKGGEFILAKAGGASIEVPQPSNATAVDLALVTLPGLTGRWWFEETPWFLPEMREKLKELPDVHVTAYPPPDGQVPGRADGVRGRHVAELLRRVRAGCELYLRSLDRDDPSRAGTLHGLLSDLDRESPDDGVKLEIIETARSLENPHLLALVQHRLGQPEAQKSYEEAVTRYQSQLRQKEDPLLRGLYAVCRSDLGMLQFSKDEFAKAKKTFFDARRQAQVLGQDAVAFEISCLAQEVLAGRKLATSENSWKELDQRMAEAFQLTNEHLDPAHPLIAFLHERRAWMLMDQWRVSEARRDFQEAIKLRNQCLTENLIADSASAVQAILHGEHGLAMCDLFSGDVEKARASYLTLHDRIVDMLNQGGAEAADLVERLVNTTERLGDTFLMSHQPLGEGALTWYQDAYSYAQQLGPTTVTSGDPDTLRARLLLKIALAAAVAGQREQFSRALARYREMPLQETQLASLDAYQRAASAIVELNSDSAEKVAGAQESLRKSLRDALPDPKTEANDSAKKGLGRETFELMLLVWGRLISSRAAGTNKRVADDQLADDVNLVFRIRPKNLRDTPVLSYLKPYYDIAIEAELRNLDTDDPAKLLRDIYAATKTEQYRLKKMPYLAFYFFAAEQLGGAAVLYSPSQPVQVFRLVENDSRIQQVTKEGSRLPIPKELDARLKGLSQTECLPWPYKGTCPYSLPPTVTFPDDIQ